MARSRTEPASPQAGGIHRPIPTFLSQHFELDPATGAVRGPKLHDKNMARTVHDIFNLVALLPICLLNLMCWNWGKLPGLFSGAETIPSMWTGTFFAPFFFTTLVYFLADVIWVIVVPKCVASPSIIIGHHCATLIYLLVPYLNPEYQWLMGACLSVEVNTWFLIARRVFNRDGKQPFTFQADTPGGPVQIKFISLNFYVTWVFIRLVLYPVLYFVICAEYGRRVIEKNSYFNAIMPAPILQAVFVGLNLLWSKDLLMSKIRAKPKGKKDKGGL